MADVPTTAVKLAGLAMTPDGALYVTGISTAITIGTTTITGGATTEVLYNLAGVVQSTSKLIINAAAGQGPSIVAGTAITDVAALSVTRTNNNAAVATGVKFTFTDTSSAAGFLPFQILGGAGGATNLLSLSKAGQLQMPVGSAGTPTYVFSGSLTTGIYARASDFITISQAGVDTLEMNSAGVALPAASYVAWTNASAHDSPDTVVSRIAAGVIGFGLTAAGQVTGTVAATNYRVAAKPVILGTAPTIASGGCTSPTVTDTNGTAYFTIDVGTSCSGSQPVVFTLPAATTGWLCTARHVTTPASNIPRQSGAISTTSVTITNYAATTGLAAAWVDGDDVTISCMGG